MLNIDITPNMIDAGGFVVSWHGFFAFVAVALAVVLTARWSSRSDLHVGKLELELQPLLKLALGSATSFFRVVKAASPGLEEDDGHGEPQPVDAASPERVKASQAELQNAVDALRREEGTSWTVIGRDGAIVATTEEHQDGRALRRELQGVFAGREERQVRTLRAGEVLVMTKPVVVEGRVLGAVRVVAPTAAARTRTLDSVYGIAIWAVIGGIVGSRIVHVIDDWDFYQANPEEIVAIWNGGIALWGAILGGLIGGVAAARFYKVPAGKLADITALAMLPGQAIGRIGDLINGEHISKITDVPWGVVWSHPDSPTFRTYGLAATHPTVAYELLYDLLLFALLWTFVRERLKPDGMLFVAYLAFYAFGRFFMQFYRVDRVWAAGLQEAHFISLGIILVTVLLLGFRATVVPREAPAAPPSERLPAAAGARRT
ncbi:MAG: hypothetical protein EXR48_03940 [Dehalococcoidia bacterium]|nr:hypothetical protein [Dehalococcoidia bacterium]